MPAKTILLVEDTAFFERIVRRRLAEGLGFTVISAASRQEAAELLRDPAAKPSLALVDLTLPDAPDGEIVDLTIAAGLPTIVFSGRFDEKLRQTVLKKGAVDYVLKDSPASLSYLASLVSRVISNRLVDALVVDDSRADLAIITRRLRNYQLRVHTATSGAQALDRLDGIENLRLVILDHLMPQIDGFELLRSLRARYDLDEIAIIGLSSNASPEITARFLKSGANDFLSKACTPEEFMLRVSQNLDMLDRIKALSDLANRDSMTGLSNRRHLFSEGATRFHSVREMGEPVAIAVFDVDTFKQINDRYGHDVGDELICRIADAIRSSMPKDALAARLGGDEFCLVLPGVSGEAAMPVLEEIRQAMSAVRDAMRPRLPLPEISVSVGVSGGFDTDLGMALKVADMCLYKAKEAGRDRVIAAA